MATDTPCRGTPSALPGLNEAQAAAVHRAQAFMEQNLGQPGNPAARITEDEVKAAFGKGGKAALTKLQLHGRRSAARRASRRALKPP